jgi:hypothetical protein
VEKIRWAPKVPKERVSRLYRDEARGLPDPMVVEEVGGRLFERCQSVLMVSDANGVLCPMCQTALTPQGNRWTQSDTPTCRCGWSCTFAEWSLSWRHRELNGANAVDAFRAYVQSWPTARTIRRQMVLIDQLIHAFHYGLRQDPGRPAANNLIEGSVAQVVQLLDEIGGTTFGLSELRAEHASWQSTTSGMVRRRRSSRSAASSHDAEIDH